MCVESETRHLVQATRFSTMCTLVLTVVECRSRSSCSRGLKQSSDGCMIAPGELFELVKSSSVSHGTRRESLAALEHHMHRVAKWLAASHAWATRRVVWKIDNSCAPNLVASNQTPGRSARKCMTGYINGGVAQGVWSAGHTSQLISRRTDTTCKSLPQPIFVSRPVNIETSYAPSLFILFT